MQLQSTYWLEKVLKMISLYVNALLRTLQHIVIHAMQLSGVNSLRIDTAELPYGRSQTVTVPDAVHIKLNLLKMSIIMIETCSGL